MIQFDRPTQRWGQKTFLRCFLDAVSKSQIAFEDKAQSDENAQHIKICEHLEEGCNAAIGR